MMGNYDGQKKSSSSSSCNGCIKIFKWVPVLFILGIIVWSYYAYTYQLCILSIEHVAVKVIYLILYNFVIILFLWSYYQTIFTPIGTVPLKWRIPSSELDKLIHAESQEQQKHVLEMFARDLPVCNRTITGAVRFCDKCQIIKPDRAHHCSVCGCCVLKMDHHCPWVNNCVNFTNYKFFILFLGYALVYCIFVALTSMEYFYKFWMGELKADGAGRFHILFLFFVSVMFAISIISLFGYHIYLVLVNRTTLEAFRAPIFRIGGPDKNGFNLGKKANFQEVFGDNWKYWCLPIQTSLGDGSQYKIQSHHLCPYYDSTGDTSIATATPATIITIPNNNRLDSDDSDATDKFLNKSPTNNIPNNIDNNTSLTTITSLNNSIKHDSNSNSPENHQNSMTVIDIEKSNNVDMLINNFTDNSKNTVDV